MTEKTNEKEKSTEVSSSFLPFISGYTDVISGVITLYREKEEWNESKLQEFTQVSVNVNEHLVSSQKYQLGLIVLVLAVPLYLTQADFLSFIGSFSRTVSHFRFVRDSAPNRYMVIIKFKTTEDSKEFYKLFHGKPFNSLQPEICHVGFVGSIEIKASNDSLFFFQPSSLIELPTCPVCLERMDASITGVLTILCHHTFHCSCLSKWNDSSCPVCRYTQNRTNNPNKQEANICAECGTMDNLWICLICGNIGCGRYQQKHAIHHYDETGHMFSLELETQRVWDYAGDNYVHRLVVGDGKLVELPSPQPSAEKVGLEFSDMLCAQLESQRLFYEAQLELLQTECASRISELEQSMTVLRKIEKEKLIYEKRVSLMEKKLKIKETDLGTEKQMNNNLLERVTKLKIENEEKEKENLELKDQLRDIMFYLETQSKLKNDLKSVEGGSIIEIQKKKNSKR